MAISTKERAYLRSLSNDLPTIIQIGKNGINENLIKTASDALEARELIKINVLENSGESAKDMAQELSDLLGADVVSVVGHKVILYRESENNKKIIL